MPVEACVDGIVQYDACVRDARLHLEEPYTSYFSWWNVVLSGVGLALALLVFLPLNFWNGGAYLRTRQAWWVHYIITPLIVTSCVTAASLTLASQALFAHNLDRMIVGVDSRARRTISPVPAPGTAPTHEVSLQVPALQRIMRHNVAVHIVPGAVAVVVLLVLASGSLHGADVRTVVLSTLLMCVVLWAMYFATPIVGMRDGRTYVGWAKMKYVYSNPSPWTFAGHCLFAVACALLIPYFVLQKGTASSSGTALSAGPALSTAPALSTGQMSELGQEAAALLGGHDVPSLSEIVQRIRADVGTAATSRTSALPVQSFM
jgi:hypothetical protein